jgi:Tol biopolymer transport system component
MKAFKARPHVNTIAAKNAVAPQFCATRKLWKSLDTNHAVIRGNQLVTRDIGKARIVGALGNANDTVSTFVLGGLLIGTDGDGGPNVYTVGLGGGRPFALLPKGTPGAEPALSPKGDRIAFVSNKRIFVMESDGSNIRRLTPDMGGRMSSYEEHSPSWSHDGARIVFISNAPGNYEVLSMSADGKDVQNLTNDRDQERNVATAPDLPRIAFERAVAYDNSEVVIALPDGSQQQRLPATQLAPRHFSQVKPKFLPGGTEMVVVRKWPGREGEALYIVRVDSSQVARELLHEEQDHSVTFAVSPDGKLIAYYRNADWGKKNNSIVIMDRTGGILRTINLGAAIEIKSLGWGAKSIRDKEAK